MSSPERPRVGQVVTVFRNRLAPVRPDLVVDGRTPYERELEVVAELARSMPGFVETKTFVADDGERATIVTFADAESHRGWRDHPRHREAQRRGVAEFYAEYSIAVGTTSYASAFRRDSDRPADRPVTDRPVDR